MQLRVVSSIIPFSNAYRMRWIDELFSGRKFTSPSTNTAGVPIIIDFNTKGNETAAQEMIIKR